MRPWLRPLASGVVLLAALAFLHVRSSGEAVPIRQPLERFPATLGPWQGRESSVYGLDILQVLKSTDYVMRRYVDSSGRSLWLFVGYWESQRKGAQPHSPRNCLPGGGWEPLDATRITIPLPGPHAPISVNRFIIQKDREQQVILYWYDAQGKVVPGELGARIEMVKNAITRNRTDGALVRVSSPVYGSLAETTEWLVRYVQTMFPALTEYLPG